MNYSKEGVRRQEAELRKGSGRWCKKFGILLVKVIIVAAIAGIFLACSAGFGAISGIIDSAPDISNIDVTPSGFSTFVYDADGNQIAKLVSTDSNRIPVTGDMVPKNLSNAFVAIEDARFYQHNGIDIQGIIRAAFIAIKSGHASEGASTITQQLIKNNVLTSWTKEGSGMSNSKIKRKVQEQHLALQLEKNMSKPDILLNYMNTINLGQNCLGVQAASLRYFNKPVSELNLSECAVIAGITQNPSRFNPILHPDQNAKRRKKVLDNMLDQKFITKAEYDEAIADDVYSRIQIVDSKNEDNAVNSYFVDALTENVINDLIEAGYTETQAYSLLYSGGLKIYSTEDPKIQAIADEIFLDESNYPSNTKFLLDYALTIKKADGSHENFSDEKMETYFKATNKKFSLLFSSKDAALEAIEKYKAAVLGDGDKVYDERYTLTPQPQVSMTIEDQSTGYVVAIEGGRGEKTASRTLNRATDATRQPGSAFKVLAAYAPAIDSAGYTLATTINDAPFAYDSGVQVRNWYKGYRGLSSIREGIRDSMNVVTVKLMTLITPQLGFDYLTQKFHFTTLIDKVKINGKIYSDKSQTLCLGGITKGIKNIEINAAYAAIANGGVYYKPTLYTKVVDHDGNILLDNTNRQGERILKESSAFLLTSAMQDVVSSGTGKAVNFGGTDIAAKTGTTTGNNDVWLCGFTNYYTTSCWAGYDTVGKLSSSAETHLAKTMWKKVMSKIHKDLPAAKFKKPSDVTTATVCSQSGLLPSSNLCGGSLKTEYFAEGTVPTETCNVHMVQTICNYCGLPATEQCPFKVTKVSTVVPVEPQILWKGSGYKGQVTADGVPTSQTCPHNEAFFAQPNAQEILAIQNQEIVNRISAETGMTPEQITGNTTQPQPDPNAQQQADPNAQTPQADPNAQQQPQADPNAQAQQQADPNTQQPQPDPNQQGTP
ncbi:transglycosylase domain-containing protein [Butyrivibrio sp. NC3005]|uniref:transglycosylase domain-containing protein n=1 Tax=Butyrivibrio sp. NC3005 TaxID=1280685 RepID=UPI0004156CE9|nr:transglycosylase domain-containing protein [Butyrivibrio sp. NC3005]